MDKNKLDELLKNKYAYLVSDYLKASENFMVFFGLMLHEFNITDENIRTFNDLVDPDRVPMKFIEALGSYFNYHYIYNASDDFNREVLTRMRTIWEPRGTEHSIIMAATHGDNKGWVGGDIFIPGYPISKDLATLDVADQTIFRHDISVFSGPHVLSDGYLHRPGIIIINVPYINDEIREKVREQIPAGIRVGYNLTSTFYPSEGAEVGEYGELSSFKDFRVWPKTEPEKSAYDYDTDIDVLLSIELPYLDYNEDTLIHSVHGRLHSGSRTVMEFYENTSELSVAMLSPNILNKIFKVEGKYLDEDKYIVSDTGEVLDTKEKSVWSILRDTTDFDNENITDVDYSYSSMNTAIRSTNSACRSGTPGKNKVVRYIESVRENTKYHCGLMSGPKMGNIDSFVRKKKVLPTDHMFTMKELSSIRPNAMESCSWDETELCRNRYDTVSVVGS